MYYTNEKNVQILIGILKYNNIRKVIASPGTMNVSFVASIQNDPFFQVYSCVDERSACYMACGLAVESNEPVVITCTGATASRNYLSGLTEAYYRKIPVIAVTCAPHFSKIANNIPQVIDRTAQLKDVVKLSVQIPTINSPADERGCNILINKAILELKRNGGGPVHINIVTGTEDGNSFQTKTLPNIRMIDRITFFDSFPNLKEQKVAIFVGAHKKWDEELTSLVDQFCEIFDSVVLCDHTSNYQGKYKIMPNIIWDQDNYDSPIRAFDIIIHIGDVSGSYLSLKAKEFWRVNPDGEIRDTYFKLRYVFDMEEKCFFNKYIKECTSKIQKIDLYRRLKKEEDELHEKVKRIEFPFSNIWVAQKTIECIPSDSCVHLGILNSLRSWNYFVNDNNNNFYSNTGGFGIDGVVSAFIGASLCNVKKLYFLVLGDLAFFYDLNSLGNRHVGNNIRIILINNGCGTEFHNYSHPAFPLGEMVEDYIAADGHFGKKSSILVKNYVEGLGFEYLTASNKEEFLSNIEYFTSKELYDKPIVFEIFTNSEEESQALKQIRSLKMSTSGTLKQKAKKILKPKIKKQLKKIIGK